MSAVHTRMQSHIWVFALPNSGRILNDKNYMHSIEGFGGATLEKDIQCRRTNGVGGIYNLPIEYAPQRLAGDTLGNRRK